MCTANRACTISRLPDRETARTRIHTAAIHACADQSQSNPPRQSAQKFSWRSLPDSTPAQNIRRTLHLHAREIQIFPAAPGFPQADRPNLSPSFPKSQPPCPHPRAQRAPQARLRPFVQAHPSALFQTSVAALRRSFHACSVPDRSLQSFSFLAGGQPPTMPPDSPSFRRRTSAPEILSSQTSPQSARRLLFPAPTLRAPHPAHD